MGFIPEITCRHCGKKFSAIHNRCPNCGTRRVKQTSRTAPTTASVKPGTAAAARMNANTKWQFIFGCILVAAVILAVIILITSSLGPAKPVETPAPSVEVTTPPPTPTPTEPPTPTIPVTSVAITFLGSPVTEFTQRIEWAPIDLNADVYPTDALATATIEWRSSNEDVATVDADGVVTAVGSGSCEIIAECGGVATKCNVLVP